MGSIPIWSSINMKDKITADEIADMADSGKDVSKYFTNSGVMKLGAKAAAYAMFLGPNTRREITRRMEQEHKVRHLLSYVTDDVDNIITQVKENNISMSFFYDRLCEGHAPEKIIEKVK